MNPYMRGKTNRRGFLREPPPADVFERVTLGVRGRHSGNRFEVSISAALVATNAPAVKRLVIDAVLGEGAELVALDLWQCEHADARGLGLLVSLASWCKTRSVTLVLAGVCDDIRTRMRAADIEKLFTIQERSPDTVHSPEAHYS